MKQTNDKIQEELIMDMTELKKAIAKEKALHASRKEICLYDLITLGLIISEPSGVFYYNQCGGISCMQNYAEGIFTFIYGAPQTLYKRIADYTENMMDGLKPEDADFIDSVLEKYTETNFLSVDRSMLDKSMEAWIYVNIDEEKIKNATGRDSWRIGFKGFSSEKGVLTWENSD
jgi:hypothetical protein